MTGAIFENYVIADILKRELHQKTHADLYYYRESNGVEIDLIIDRKSSKDLIEIKFSHTFKPTMIKPIEALLNPTDRGYLLYNGKAINLLPNLQAINFNDYLDPT